MFSILTLIEKTTQVSLLKCTYVHVCLIFKKNIKANFQDMCLLSTFIKIKINVDEKSTKSDKSKKPFSYKDLSDNVLLKNFQIFM